MESKFTPGPWMLCYDGRIDGADGMRVIEFDWDSYKEFNDCPEHEKANARLMAAAPELLAALMLAQSIIGHPGDAHSQYIASVIAKATGVAQ